MGRGQSFQQTVLKKLDTHMQKKRKKKLNPYIISYTKINWKWISDQEDKIVEITTTEQNKEKRMKRIEDSLRDLGDNSKRNNIWIIEYEKKKGPEKIFEEIIVENFPNMGKEIVKSRKHRESHTG